MKVWITGGTGLIGRALVSDLRAQGHEVHRLSLVGLANRMATTDPELSKSVQLVAANSSEPDGQTPPFAPDAVIHLAGAPISRPFLADKLASYLQLVRDSRILSTRLLARSFSNSSVMPQPPRVFISGSAVGVYPTNSPTAVDEASPTVQAGTTPSWVQSFVTDWESAAAPVAAGGTRLINLRTGVVLASEGGLLATSVKMFRSGIGGYAGSGAQIVPWIALDDVVGIVKLALSNEAIKGPLNAVAPEANSAREVAEAIGRALDRKSWSRTPESIVIGTFGKERAEIMLKGVAVKPTAALAAGYKFKYTQLDALFKDILTK